MSSNDIFYWHSCLPANCDSKVTTTNAIPLSNSVLPFLIKEAFCEVRLTKVDPESAIRKIDNNLIYIAIKFAIFDQCANREGSHNSYLFRKYDHICRN